MPTTVKDLRIYQIGKETTKGTGVPATTRLVGDLLVSPKAQVFQPQPQLGILLENPTSDVIVLQHTEMEWSGDLTYEQILHLLHCSLKGAITPTGAGADKTWTFTPVFTADNALDSFTVERRLSDGTSNFDEEVNYVLCRDFMLSGAIGENAKFRANLFGRKVDRTSTLTAAIAVPAVNFVGVADAKLYIDNTFAGLGTTQVSGDVFGFELALRAQYQPKFYIDGRTDRSFTSHAMKRMGYDFRVSVEWDTTINGERAKADDRSIRYVRLQFVGAALGGSNYRITIDMALRYAEGMFDQESDREGNDSVDLRFISAYDTTNLIGIKAVVVNALAALP